MALTASQALWARQQVVDTFAGATVDVTKADVDTAIAALTTWAEANQASAVASMNGTALAGKSGSTKAKCLAIAITARYGGMA